MEINFYGTRGSTPVSGKEFIEYGGNTTCITIRSEDSLLIVDCGTGMQRLQREQFGEGGFQTADILLTHLHWDHIQGIAFFEPFFRQESSFRIYGEARDGLSVKNQIEGIMKSPMFPVSEEAFQASIEYQTISCGTSWIIGNKKIETIRLNHPNICTGYKIEWKGKIICILSDCELYSKKLEVFAKNADLLICDAQYTKTEYQKKVGWGHGTWESVCDFAKECGAKKVILTHHDPGHTDSFLHQIEKEVQEVLPEATLAYDGLKYQI